MASTNFKLFDENKTNMMSDTEYNINTQRLNGVQAGIASSQLQNKTLYQTSLMSYALAQIMNQNGIDANDTAAVSAFVNGLSDTLVQKVLDKATEQMAFAGTDNSHYMTPALVKKSIIENDIFGKLEYRGKITKLQYAYLNNAIGEVTLVDYGNSSGVLEGLNSIILKYNSFSVETFPRNYNLFWRSEKENGTFTQQISGGTFECLNSIIYPKSVIEFRRGIFDSYGYIAFAASGAGTSPYNMAMNIDAYGKNIKTKKLSIGIVNHTGSGDSIDCDIDVYVKIVK